MVKGTVFRYGDNVDTDVIIPARYLNAPSPEELAKHCMEDIDAAYATSVKPGDIMVGGWNFGCGSSREHAPIAIKAAGISCVIAKSFARIHEANLINTGILPLTFADPADYDKIEQGDILELPNIKDAIANGTPITLVDKTKGISIPVNCNLDGRNREIILDGGLLNYLRSKM